MQSAEVQKSLLTAPEAAKRLAICQKSLWSITHPRGPLCCVRIGRSVRYSEQDIDAFVAAQRSGGGAS